jgi:hypothetical protein
MPQDSEQNQNPQQAAEQNKQDDLTRKVAERVWQLWQLELKLERERQGKTRR